MKSILPLFFAMVAATSLLTASLQADDAKPIRVGIIGLDTSHAIAFTKQFNQETPDPSLKNCRVVAAYPYGSRTIESSYSRIPKYTEQVKEMGVEIVDSIDELLGQVDAVLLETNDGKPHLQQAQKVFEAGKPVFIDKPVGSNLAEVIAIFQAAEQHKVKVFSSSALRYSPAAQQVRAGKIGEVLGCDTYSPSSLEPSHVDLFWYGIHGVEPLFTCMGTGCETVRYVGTKDTDLVTGVWSDGRIGTFRGTRSGKHGYGGTAFGSKGNQQVGPYAGYQPLLVEIAAFFESGEVPIDPQETIEIYAFMQAASESKKNGGAPYRITDVIADAKVEAEKLLGE